MHNYFYCLIYILVKLKNYDLSEEISHSKPVYDYLDKTSVNGVVVAGDVFDINPSHEALRAFNFTKIKLKEV